jgi:hypothetical protein
MSIQQMLFGGSNPVTYTAVVASIYLSGKTVLPGGIAPAGTGLYVLSQNSTDFTANLVKLTSTGTVSWQRQLSLSGATAVDIYGSSLVALSCASDSSGNVYIAGTFTNSGSVSDGFLVKYNTSGTIQWQRKINAASGQSVSNMRVAIDSTGSNVVVLNNFTKSSATATAVLSYNSSGVLQWQRQLYTGSFNSVSLSALTIDSSGNIFISGIDQVGGSTKGSLLKYNSSGTLQWQQQVLSANNLPFIGLDTSGNIYCGGGGPKIAKFNSSGSVTWGYNFTVTDSAGYALAVDPTTGTSYGVYDNGSNTVTVSQWDNAATNLAKNNIGLTGNQNIISLIAGGTLGVTGYYGFTKGIWSQSLAGYTTGVWLLPSNMANTGPGSLSVTVWTQSSYTAGSTYSNSSVGLSTTANSITDAAGTHTDAAGAFTDAAGGLSVAQQTF